MNRLTGKVVLINGAISVEGRAITDLFHREGASIVLTDIFDSMNDFALLQSAGKGKYLKLDPVLESDWQAVFDFLLYVYEKIDILVNIAKITGSRKNMFPGDPEHTTLDNWHKFSSFSLDGIFLGSKYAIKEMKSDGGTIINLASRSNYNGFPSLGIFNSAGEVVGSYTRVVSEYCEGLGYDISCNSIRKNEDLTACIPSIPTSRDISNMIEKAIAQGIPLGHFGYPQDVAYAALYFATGHKRTGDELIIDNGIYMNQSIIMGNTLTN